MKSPGITINPINTLDDTPVGDQEINSVFFDNVKVPVENLVGKEGEGWTCAKYLLTFERGSAYAPTCRNALRKAREIAKMETVARRAADRRSRFRPQARGARNPDRSARRHRTPHLRQAVLRPVGRRHVVADENARLGNRPEGDGSRARSRRRLWPALRAGRLRPPRRPVQRAAAHARTPRSRPPAPTSTTARPRSTPAPTRSSATSWRR